MRSRIGRTAVLLGAAAAAIALTAPVASAANAKKSNSVRGTGTTSIATVTIDASNVASVPTSPGKGRFTAKSSTLDLRGPVTCLRVEGNSAGLIYRVEEGSSPVALVGRDVFVTVLDRGPKENQKMGFLPPGTTPPGGGCSPSIMMKMDALEITDGRFVITDVAKKF